jgi:hypothetical protein
MKTELAKPTREYVSTGTVVALAVVLAVLGITLWILVVTRFRSS